MRAVCVTADAAGGVGEVGAVGDLVRLGGANGRPQQNGGSSEDP